MAIDVKKANQTLFKKKLAPKKKNKTSQELKLKKPHPKVDQKQVKSESKIDREYIDVILNRNIFVDGEFKKYGESASLPYYEALRLKGISYAEFTDNTNYMSFDK